MPKRTEHKITDAVELKYCLTCKKWLSLDRFGVHNFCWDGLNTKCKNCRKKYTDAHRGENKIRCKKWRLINIKKARKDDRRRYRTNLERKKQCRIRTKKWTENNSEKMKNHQRKWQKKNRSTPKGRLRCNISTAVWECLKNGKRGKSTFDLLGYSIEQLRDHLIKTMPDGYDWNDYMSGKLHIDHIIPISVHNFEKVEDIDFERCWALSNLQLLPVFDNLSKGNKIDEPFQPSFVFG